ncbi:MAG TPA: hypothetical protein PKC28_05390 [Bdellovibrionales bacterium]|nr:hypothetical protein [Bdellovibrionales bacterium]
MKNFLIESALEDQRKVGEIIGDIETAMVTTTTAEGTLASRRCKCKRRIVLAVFGSSLRPTCK